MIKIGGKKYTTVVEYLIKKDALHLKEKANTLPSINLEGLQLVLVSDIEVLVSINYVEFNTVKPSTESNDVLSKPAPLLEINSSSIDKVSTDTSKAFNTDSDPCSKEEQPPLDLHTESKANLTKPELAKNASTSGSTVLLTKSEVTDKEQKVTNNRFKLKKEKVYSKRLFKRFDGYEQRSIIVKNDPRGAVYYGGPIHKDIIDDNDDFITLQTAFSYIARSPSFITSPRIRDTFPKVRAVDSKKHLVLTTDFITWLDANNFKLVRLSDTIKGSECCKILNLPDDYKRLTGLHTIPRLDADSTTRKVIIKAEFIEWLRLNKGFILGSCNLVVTKELEKRVRDFSH